MMLIDSLWPHRVVPEPSMIIGGRASEIANNMEPSGSAIHEVKKYR